MEKKLEKLRKQIFEATKNRAISKATYDSQVIILEGKRKEATVVYEAKQKEVQDLELYNQKLSDEYVASVNKVEDLMRQEKELLQELETKTENHEES